MKAEQKSAWSEIGNEMGNEKMKSVIMITQSAIA